MYKLCKTERSAKRQREIEQILLDLMQEKRFEEISVTEICERANMPRKSFYRYFFSKEGALYALLDHTLMAFYDDGNLEGLRGNAPTEDLKRMFIFWKDNKKLLNAIARSNLAGVLIERAVALAKQEELMPGYVSEWDDMLKDIAMSFAVCGLMSMVLQWHKESYKIPPEIMAQAAVTMLSKPLLSNM